MKRIVLAAVVLLGLLLALGFEEGRLLLFGWIGFLSDVVPRTRVNGTAVVSGLVAIVVFVGLTELVGHWCLAAVSQETPPRQWRFRWSLAVLLAFVLMFAAGYSAIGLARHLGWLWTSQEPLYGQRLAHGLEKDSSQNLRTSPPVPDSSAGEKVLSQERPAGQPE